MKVVSYCSDKPREHMIAQAMKLGIEAQGSTFEIRRTADYGEDDEGNDRKWPGPDPETDVAIVFGVKGISSQLLKDHLAMGKHTLFLDKGFTREKGENSHTKYTRVAVDATSPASYMMNRKHDSKRASALNINLESRKNPVSGHILYCGSSQKYNDFHGLGHSTAYAQKVFSSLRKLTPRQLIYRPKPSWKGYTFIKGSSHSPSSTSIHEALKGCFCLVTHGSTAAMDAVISGVPSIVLGQGIASPVASNQLESIVKPFWPDDETRMRWINAMSYCQWTLDEFRSGEAWEYIKGQLRAAE